MSRFFSYLNSAVSILEIYKGEEPFASFLKKYFSRHKKFGSKDRRQVSHLCYCYFRLGKATAGATIEERLLIALFLCSDSFNDILQHTRPDWNEHVALSPGEKLSMLTSRGYNTDLFNAIFPWDDKISAGISHPAFCRSFLIQPDMFLRIRPGREEAVKDNLRAANIDFSCPRQNTIKLSNAVDIGSIIALNRDAVVQDLSSQETGDLLQLLPPITSAPARVWDCCTASGGKSLMTVDILGKVELHVSDIRTTILHNLEKRFAAAGITGYHSFVADLSRHGAPLPVSDMDLIICDAPCTGSGTWGRTPEQLYYFDEREIQRYSALQKSIASNAIGYLKPGGHLLYITCSVFTEENEGVVSFLSEKFGLSIKKQEVIKGYDKKADTMFAALLAKSL